MAAEKEPIEAPAPEQSSHKTIGIRRDTDEKIRRLFGGKSSYADIVDALVDDAARERRIENVRRRILGVKDALESFVGDAVSAGGRIIGDSSHEARRIIRDSGRESSVPTRAERRRRAR